MKIFVTGGAGVIGRELVPRLVAGGASVVVGDLQSRPESFPPGVEYREGDLNDLTTDELLTIAPEAIIHLAATFERSIETEAFWTENFRHNVTLSHHIMTIAHKVPSLKRVVFASSYLVYDRDRYEFSRPPSGAVLLDEHSPLKPRNLTGMAKLSHENELAFLTGLGSAPYSVVSARIFRGFGKGSRDVVSRWVRAALTGQPLEVYRPEGMFDFIYAGDSAEGLRRLALDSDVTGPVNLGSGHARRISDVIQSIQARFPESKIVLLESDIPFEASEAQISRLIQHVDWRPTHTLEDGLDQIVEYERQQLDV